MVERDSIAALACTKRLQPTRSIGRASSSLREPSDGLLPADRSARNKWDKAEEHSNRNILQKRRWEGGFTVAQFTSDEAIYRMTDVGLSALNRCADTCSGQNRKESALAGGVNTKK